MTSFSSPLKRAQIEYDAEVRAALAERKTRIYNAKRDCNDRIEQARTKLNAQRSALGARPFAFKGS